LLFGERQLLRDFDLKNVELFSPEDVEAFSTIPCRVEAFFRDGNVNSRLIICNHIALVVMLLKIVFIAVYLIKAISLGLFAARNNESNAARKYSFSQSTFSRILLKFKRKHLNITR
jgi:hypothetical protein